MGRIRASAASLRATLGATLRRVAGWRSGRGSAPSSLLENPYEAAWETMARHDTSDHVVGVGDFDLVGRMALGVLLMEDLRPSDTLVDLGCGNGRLAVHVIPQLVGGRYIGIDISPTMLERARQRVVRACPRPPCDVEWIRQTSPPFPLEAHSVDMICAFSVFTHLEHEDTYRYLADALRIVRPAGRFVFSCLPMDLPYARHVFMASAKDDFQRRWSTGRNVTTSVELMDVISRLAGWTPLRWYAGDQPSIRVAGSDAMGRLNQSVCVLAASPEFGGVVTRKPGSALAHGINKVHVGCGPHNLLEDWWNVDIRQFLGADEVLDVTRPWKWRDLDYVYGEHFLEHLAPDDAFAFLEHAGNSLRVGGVLRLSTPNLEWVMLSHFQTGPVDRERRLRETIVINRAFHGWGHRFLYSREMLAHILEDMRFQTVEFHSYGESRNPELCGLERHGDFQVFEGQPSVLIVEATRGREPIAASRDLRKRFEEEFLQHIRSGH